MYYDPMIAKLCTWAPDRGQAIEAMRNALDGFEVEGIGHNLPFLSAVMDHPRFVSGDITTAFIAEEYPDGFTGWSWRGRAAPDRGECAAMHRVAEIRRTRISGRMDNHERHVGADWVVSLQDRELAVTIDADRDGATVRFKGWRHAARGERLDAGRQPRADRRGRAPARAQGRQDHAGASASAAAAPI